MFPRNQPACDATQIVWRRLALAALLLFTFAAQLAAQSDLRYADLGNCPLTSGETILGCRLAYRTHGKLNDDKSNAILFPTWFSGNSEDLTQYIGPDKMLDSSKYFVVAVDAFGNGLSSSPSNSQAQPGATFPRFGIRDMVNSQHRLLTEVLGIEHLHAVIGISMGGMQTLQWMVSYPDFMDNAIPIVGSPRLGSYDLLLWNTELEAIESAYRAYSDPKQARAAAMRMVAAIHELALSTPANVNAKVAPQDLPDYIATKAAERIDRSDPYDWASQLRAMIDHDIAKEFGGSLEQAAAAVEADVLVIASEQDHMVSPGPVLDFAEHVSALVVVLAGDCGHIAVGCEIEEVQSEVRSFLSQE
jgi:homoserine O-acetyltransferase